MHNTQNDLPILSLECWYSFFSSAIVPNKNDFFSEAVSECFETLMNITLVCSDWSLWAQGKNSTAPILARFINDVNYAVDFPIDSTATDKIKLYLASFKVLRATYFRFYWIHNQFTRSNIDFKKNNIFISGLDAMYTDFTFIDFHLNPETNITDALVKMIASGKKKHLEFIGKFFHFMPNFDTNTVALALSKDPVGMEEIFLICLMIKLKYDMSLYFKNNPHFIQELAAIHLFNSCKDIPYEAYDAAGCIFSNYEKNVPEKSIFEKLMPILILPYRKGSFYLHESFTEDLGRIPFKDASLTKHIRTELFTEEDVKNYLIYLLNDAKLNLDIVCPAVGSLKEGTVLSQLRQLGEWIKQQPNAISLALEDYDLKQERLYMRQNA